MVKNLAALAAAVVADSEQHAVVVVVVYHLAEAERPDDNCEKIFQFLLLVIFLKLSIMIKNM